MQNKKYIHSDTEKKLLRVISIKAKNKKKRIKLEINSINKIDKFITAIRKKNRTHLSIPNIETCFTK